ncbi:hypothetical protein BGX28_010315 [Mortierella sp. GBA30]|nr:hypothetical protein BGX28_010315 [Mortierella sp. GBA30]
MIQVPFVPDAYVQNHVDLGPQDYEQIMGRGFPFMPVKRVNINKADALYLRSEVENTCVAEGTPLVFEGWHNTPNWNQSLFTFPHIVDIYGNTDVLCRDQHLCKDVKMSMKEYIHEVHADSLRPTSSNSIARDDTSALASYPKSRSRRDACVKARVSSAQIKKQPEPLLYAKDVSCPEPWRQHLMEEGALPQFLAYKGQNDLNGHYDLAAEDLMIYIGQAGTWTPAHIDQCGTIGHNIMVWSDKAEDRSKAEALWKSYGHPLGYENYFASVDELARADFPIYVVEQKIGDFIIVPSQSYHQVINLGKATIKVAWGRLTSNCLRTAIECVLPRYREIGRPEGFRIKMITHSALKAWTVLLGSQTTELPMPTDQFSQSFRTVLSVFKTIVEEEWVDLSILKQSCATFIKPRQLSIVSPATCDFCSSDIWNRQMYCTQCTWEGDSYDLCTQCFALGRGCKHRAGSMEFVEQFSMGSLRRLHADAIDAWNNSRVLAGLDDYEKMINEWEDGLQPSTKKGYSYGSLAYKRQMLLKDSRLSCHLCLCHNSNFVTAECSKCLGAYCETCLFERHDLLWKDVESERTGWECLECAEQYDYRSCDMKAEMKRKTRRKLIHEEMMWFTQPEEDERNRGGISDLINIDRDFENNENDYSGCDDEETGERASTTGLSNYHIKRRTRSKNSSKNKDELANEVCEVPRNGDRNRRRRPSLSLANSSPNVAVKNLTSPKSSIGHENGCQHKQKSKRIHDDDDESLGSSSNSPNKRPRRDTCSVTHSKQVSAGSKDDVRSKVAITNMKHTRALSTLDMNVLYHKARTGNKREQSPSPEEDYRRSKQQKSNNIQERRSFIDSTMRIPPVDSNRQSPGSKDDLRRSKEQIPKPQDRRPTIDDPKTSNPETIGRKRKQSPVHEAEEENQAKQQKFMKHDREPSVNNTGEAHPPERSLTREEFDMAMAPATEATLRLVMKKQSLADNTGKVHPPERSLTREEFDMAMAPAAEAALRLVMGKLDNKFGTHDKDLSSRGSPF